MIRAIGKGKESGGDIARDACDTLRHEAELSGGGARSRGAKRGIPEVAASIDVRETHRAEVCPDCGGPLNRCSEARTRYTEDIPEVQPVVTEHTIHRGWCPQCRRKVVPGATLGNRLLLLSAWLRYALGNTLGQIGEVLNFHLQLPVSSGGLIQMWRRLAAILFEWYEQIRQDALNSAVLNADGPPKRRCPAGV